MTRNDAPEEGYTSAPLEPCNGQIPLDEIARSIQPLLDANEAGIPHTRTYRTLPIDANVPVIPVSAVLNLPPTRPRRQLRIQSVDEFPKVPYGDPIIQKHKGSTRLFFQNSKGLTHTTTGEDYGYYMSCLSAFQVDIFGIAETNTCWSHPHLMSDFRQHARKYYTQNRLAFSSPSPDIDPCGLRETYQAGGSITASTGRTASFSTGDPLLDPSGLGRWSGLTFQGKDQTRVSIITAYRTCTGNIKTSSMGSTFVREYEFFRSQGVKAPNPRQQFFHDLSSFIITLRNSNEAHSVILMMDANSTLKTDTKFQGFITSLELSDLHTSDPVPSTYIGAKERRIAYIFGTDRIVQSVLRAGTLAYTEGPQSDHRGLYIDLDLSSIFDPSYEPPTCLPVSKRSLVSGNPEHVAHYIDKMKEYYDHHRMYDRLKELVANHHTMTKEELRVQLEKWDADQGRAMLAAETNLMKIKDKTFSWSPKLRNSALIRKYWKLRLREMDYREDCQQTFARILRDTKRIDPTFDLPDLGVDLSRDSIVKKFTAATKEFRKCQRNATDLRAQTYHDLMLSYDDDKNPGTQRESKRKLKIIRRTILAEAQRKVYKALGQIVKPKSFNPLDKIHVPRYSDTVEPTAPGDVHEVLRNSQNRDIVWDTVIHREDMERHLLSYNREAFREASESPCGKGIIFDALTFTSLSEEALDVLNGVVPPEWYGDDLALKEFLA